MEGKAFKSHHPVEEQERRNYQGPGKRILPIIEAEYMPASLHFAKQNYLAI